MRIVEATDGLRGIDCNTVVSETAARALGENGFRFVLRYLPRVTQADHDFTPEEAARLSAHGLGVMAVQHVELPNWTPDEAKGHRYGTVAAAHAGICLLPSKSMVWLDLEEVDRHVDAATTSAYCRAWFHAVADAAFTPGLYVGDQCGLTARQLWLLPFRHYWSAYNCNLDRHPAIRSVQMRQHAATPTDGVFGFEFDTNTTHADNLGGRALLAVPDIWDY